MKIGLIRVNGPERTKPGERETHSDSRTAPRILPQDAFQTGESETVFHTGDCLRPYGLSSAEPLFLDQIPIRLGLSDAAAH